MLWLLGPAAVAAVAAYVVGRRWRGSTDTVAPAPPPAGGGVAEVRDALTGLEARSIDLPDDLALQVRLVIRSLRDLLVRIEQGQIVGSEAFVITKVATEYLPTTVDQYLKIPRAQARLPLGAGGQSAFDMARDQLGLLQTQLIEIADAAVKGDHDRLATQGRFLETRFASSPLALPPSEPSET